MKNNLKEILSDDIINRISINYGDIIKDIQKDLQFNVVLEKEQRLTEKLKALKNLEKCVVGNLFKNHESVTYNVCYLEKDFWNREKFDIDEFKTKVSKSIVILQNNDFSGITEEQLINFGKVVSEIDDAIFVIWDTDNHHWLKMSIVLSIIFDFYVPAHIENISLISKFNSNILPPLFAGSLQWKKSYLIENIDDIILKNREYDIFGIHGFYTQFELRNKIIKTLSNFDSNINFFNVNQKQKNYQEYFNEWTNSKSHICITVNNDIPYRIFDSIITGSIAIIPSSLKLWSKELKFNKQIIYFSNLDIIDPTRLVEKSSERFSSLRKIITRNEMIKIIEECHIDSRITQIISNAFTHAEL